MGFESFRVELRGGNATAREIEEALRALPHARPDPQSIVMEGSTYYVVDDGRHVIEIEFADSPARLSCRFTLCHPASVDAAFLATLRELMVRLDMTASICDDASPEHKRPFPASQFADFSTAVARWAARRRAEWIATFGPEQLAATTSMVHERIILPQCRSSEVSPVRA